MWASSASIVRIHGGSDYFYGREESTDLQDVECDVGKGTDNVKVQRDLGSGHDGQDLGFV